MSDSLFDLPTPEEKLAVARRNQKNYLESEFASMNPEYKYQEYPKWVKHHKGHDIIVNNAAEEAEATTKPESKAAEVAEEAKKPEEKSERQKLLDRAAELGLALPGNISNAKLKAAVADKEAELEDAEMAGEEKPAETAGQAA